MILLFSSFSEVIMKSFMKVEIKDSKLYSYNFGYLLSFKVFNNFFDYT